MQSPKASGHPRRRRCEVAPEVSGTPGIALKCGRGALRAPVSGLNGTRAGAQESAPTALLCHPIIIDRPNAYRPVPSRHRRLSEHMPPGANVVYRGERY